MSVATRAQIKQDGVLRLSPDIWQRLKLEAGVDVELRVEAGKLIVIPFGERKRLKLAPDIVDELVANEELYLPEGSATYPRRTSCFPGHERLVVCRD